MTIFYGFTTISGILRLTAWGARGLVDRRYGRLGDGFFGVVDDADNVLPPVDVIRERRLAEIAGLALRVVDRDEYLKNNTHTSVSQYTIDRRNHDGKVQIDRSTDYHALISTHRCPLARGSDQRRDGHQTQNVPHDWMIICCFPKTRLVTVYVDIATKIE